MAELKNLKDYIVLDVSAIDQKLSESQIIEKLSNYLTHRWNTIKIIYPTHDHKCYITSNNINDLTEMFNYFDIQPIIIFDSLKLKRFHPKENGFV